MFSRKYFPAIARGVLFFPLLLLVTSALAQQPAPLQLDLEQAVRLAGEGNHTLRLARLALAGAGAAGVAAAALPNPTLTLQSMGINPTEGIGAGGLRGKNIDSSVRVDQLIERGGKRALRREGAAWLEQAARHDLDEAARQVRLAVSLAYFDLMAAQQRAAIGAQTAALYAETVAAARQRQRAGELAGADVARLQVDALRAGNDAAVAQADLAGARQTLASLLGRSEAAAGLVASGDWPAPDAAAADGVPPASSVEQHADVLAARARVDAAASAHRLALAARSVDVSLGVQYEHFPASAAHPAGSGNSYGVAVQIPLLLGYRYQGEILAAQNALDIAQQNLEQARQQARADLLRSWSAARAAAERVRRCEDSLLPAARKSADAAEFGFRHGALGTMDVLDVRRAYRAAQLDAVAARADYAKADAAWRAAETPAPAAGPALPIR